MLASVTDPFERRFFFFNNWGKIFFVTVAVLISSALMEAFLRCHVARFELDLLLYISASKGGG